MSHVRVGVIRGGVGDGYADSLKTGQFVLRNLPSRYEGKDILITPDGTWHVLGMPMTPERVLATVDVCFVATHDGLLGQQGILRTLEAHNMPFSGSSLFATALATQKALAKEKAHSLGIRTPQALILDRGEDISDILKSVFQTLSGRLIIKPLSAGGSRDVYVLQSLNELPDILPALFEKYEELMLEEYLMGKEITVAVIEDFRGKKHYTTLPLEIVHSVGNQHLSADAKSSGDIRHNAPAVLDTKTKQDLESLAERIHRDFGLRHYSRSDFIVRPNGSIYFLEANSHPQLSPDHLFGRSLESVGVRPQDFIENILSLAQNA